MTISWKQVGIFLIILVIIIGLSNILLRYALPIKTSRLISGNMEPTYQRGDVLFYSGSANYAVNDVVIYVTSRGPSAVRIIEINEDGTYQAKGDANPVPISVSGLDETSIRQEQIMGKVSSGTSPYVFYPLVYGFEIILAVFLTFSLAKKIKK